MDKPIIQLLASSGTIEGIIVFIRRFYYCTGDEDVALLETRAKNVFDIWKNGRTLNSVRVCKKSNRYRFESIAHN